MTLTTPALLFPANTLIARQISIVLTKPMQAYGVLSFYVCTMSMFILF